MKTKEDVFEELIATVERNAIDNEAHITNVKLWASSWRREYANQSDLPKQNQKLIAALKLCLSNFERNKTGGFNGKGKRWEDGSPYQIAWTLLNNIEMDSN